MHSSHELQTMASKVADAVTALVNARTAAQENKARRQHSLIFRLYDRLFPTHTERLEASAESALETAKADGQRVASDWITATALHYLNENGSDRHRRAEQLSEISKLQQHIALTADLLKLSQNAMQHLTNAAYDCNLAWAAELVDLFNKNKTISLDSKIKNSIAAASVRSANASVCALLEALQNHRSATMEAEPGDALELAVDIALEPGIDMLSWVNMPTVQEAAVECRRIAARLALSHDRFERLTKDSHTRLGQATEVLRKIELPYLAAAAEHVPTLIKSALPTRI